MRSCGRYAILRRAIGSVLTGLDAETTTDNPHLIHLDDGTPALWAGVVDDLWNFGEPTGFGTPWDRTDVCVNAPSDPYLMNGYLHKRLSLSHDAGDPINIGIEVDITGAGQWKTRQSIQVPPGRGADFEFPRAFQAYWVRLRSDKAARIAALLQYGP